MKYSNYQGLRTHLQSVNWEEIGVGRGEDRVNEVERQYKGIVREIQMAHNDHNEIRFKINAKRKEEQNIALMPDF